MSREELDSKLATLTQAIAHLDTHKLQTNNGVTNKGRTHTYNNQYSRQSHGDRRNRYVDG